MYVCPCFRTLHNFVRTVSLNLQQVKEEPESIAMKILDITITPIMKVYEMYGSTALAEQLSLPMFIGACILTVFMIWAASRIIDPNPYLYSNKLGWLEKQSAFVDPKTGKVGINTCGSCSDSSAAAAITQK